jgi:O-antigen ligase
MKAGQQLPIAVQEIPGNFGPALLAGLFFGFHLFVMILAVWLLQATPQAGEAADIALTLFLLLVIAFAAPGDGRTLSFLNTAPSRWALAFLLVSGASLCWTAAVSLPAAAAFWSAMAADVAIVVFLLRAQTPQVVTSSLLRGYAWGAGAVAVISWILPATSDNRLGYEGLLGTNQIGFLCAFAFFLVQYLVLVEGEKHPWLMILLGVTMLRSLSKTTIIAFLLSQAILLAASRNISRRTKVLVTIGALLIALLFSSLLVSYIDDYTTTGSQAETLSGRLGIWAIMGAEAVERPVFGHGFHSVWNVIPPYGPEQFEIRHAHDEILQQFYAYGAVGILLFVGIYFSFHRQIRKLARSPLRTFLFSFLIFILIRGLADTDAFDLSLPLWCIILFSTLMQSASLREPAAALQTQQSLQASLAGSMQPQSFET